MIEIELEMIARKPATPNSWKRLPAPSMIENLGFSAQFQGEDAEELQHGLVPDGMEDKWFIYFESGWLCFHRSWTGAFIYALQLEDHDGAVRVASSWVNRDPAQYNATDTAYDRKFVAFLIDAFLLGNTNRPKD